MSFRPINYVRNPVILEDFNDGKVKPEFKKATDINQILERYKKTGIMNKMYQEPLYGDFTSVEDYQNAMNLAIKTQEQFAGLPSSLRKKFENDPQGFLEFMAKTDNIDEKRALGLLPPERQAEAPEPPAQEPPASGE